MGAKGGRSPSLSYLHAELEGMPPLGQYFARCANVAGAQGRAYMCRSID
jgi:hypothetical protein